VRVWAKILVVIVVSLIIAFVLYINSLAGELMHIACLSRPDALRLAFSMTIHNQHDLALAARPGPCP
jgi:hypothetical protein